MSGRTKHETRAGPFTVTTFVTGTWRENCHVVTDRESGASLVFDPGDDGEWLVEELRAFDVKRLLLTHAHYDHLGAARAIGDAYGLPCEVHARDALLVRRAPLYALSFERRKIQLPSDVRTFDDDARIELGSDAFTALATPGHTPGGVAFAHDAVVVSGDTLLKEAVGRVDLPGGDAAALDAGIATLLARVSPGALLFPGHGAPWLAAEARAWWAARPRT